VGRYGRAGGADINTRNPVLADFILAASTRYGLTRAPIAIGFSNGAIMAAALLLTRPSLLAGAILFGARSGR
jgi:phospholipase/carboxylesterase